MGEEFFSEGFQFEEYLNDKLMEISDLDHRRELKDVVKQMMVPFYQHVENKYQKITENLLAASRPKKRDYTIMIGLKERKKVDLTDDQMHPILMEDMEEKVIDEVALRESLKEGEPFYLFSVYLKMDYNRIRNLLSVRKHFSGQVRTEEGVYPAKFKLRDSDKYLKPVNELYPVFIRNMVSWKPVNMAHLHKFADVMICDTELPEDEAILEVTVDFEEYSEAVKYQMVPLWNITRQELRDSGYPEFCIDQIHYKHMIYKHKLKNENAYLVDNKEVNIWNIEDKDGDIEILCDKDSEVKWNLIEFHKTDKPEGEYAYFSNEDSYEGEKTIRTKAEISRYMQSLGYEHILKFVDASVQKKSRSKRETYDMNGDLLDEIRQLHRGYQLTLEFEPVNEEYEMNADILSYLVSRLQWEFPEYLCCGKLVKKGYTNE